MRHTVDAPDEIIEMRSYMETLRQLLKHIDNAHEFSGEKLLEVGSGLVCDTFGQVLIVHIHYLTTKPVSEDGRGSIGVLSEIRGIIYERMVKTFGKQAAAHSVKIHKERIGIIKRIFRNLHLASFSQVCHLDISLDMAVCEPERCRLHASEACRYGLKRLKNTVGIFLRPLEVSVGKIYVVILGEKFK